jgi:hypothetical protein
MAEATQYGVGNRVPTIDGKPVVEMPSIIGNEGELT